MANPQHLLARLLNTPDLPAVVPRLPAEILHRVIETCGLEDCADLVTLATPGQLARVLDLDIWRARTPGGEEAFDADRFGAWIEVLLQNGAENAAATLIGLDTDLVTAGLVRHAAVYDLGAVSAYTTLEGELVAGRRTHEGPAAEIGGYVLEAKRTSAWEAIVDLLAHMASEHPHDFHRLMRGCVALSDDPREEDGCDDLLDRDEQQLFDLTCEREGRRDQQGYVTPAQAHAFLRGARAIRLDAIEPPPSPIARAYFQAIDAARADDDVDAQETTAEVASPLEPGDADGAIEVLRAAGVLASEPRALLGAGDGDRLRLSAIHQHVAAHPASAEELAYLANTIMAGCAIQDRPFTEREAADAVVSICNLGLENWPAHWIVRDLIAAFQIGWSILHRDVCMYAAERLIDVLGDIRCVDRDIQLQLDGLRRRLLRHVPDGEPWRVRGALEVIMMLDAPSWAALLALIDECPAIHGAISAPRQSLRKIDASAFEFISENGQIAAIREFMASLRQTLTA